MTVRQIFDNARILLGYSLSTHSAAEYPFLFDALFIFNGIYTDLFGKTAESIESVITLSATELDAVYYGIAMLIATYAGDTPRQNMLTEIYNAKRARIKSAISSVQNVLP